MSKIVYRTLDFFEAFAASKRPLVLTELMKLLDLPASSCHDVLHALEDRGYLYELRSRGGYYPTSLLYDLARTIFDHDPFMTHVRPRLERLRDDIEESVFLVRAKGLEMTYVAVVEADLPLRVTRKVGDGVISLYASSAGKALLASLPKEELKRVLAGLKLVPMTPKTVTSKTELQQMLAEGEAQGWFVNREETIEDMWTVSARLNWNGALYIVTVAGAAKRIERKLMKIAKDLRSTVADLA